MMAQDKKRILYLTTFYPTQRQPHHGIFFRDHAEALAQKHEVALINLSIHSLKERLLNRETSQSFVEKNVFTMHQNEMVLSHRFAKQIEKGYHKGLEKAFNKLLNTWGRPDFVIAQCSLPAGQLALSLKQKEQIPYTVIEHFSFLDEQINRQFTEMEAVYASAKEVLTVNEKHIPLIKEQFKIQAKKVDNVISSDFILMERNTPPPFRWLFVGYHHPKKGIDLLEEVIRKYPQVQMTLVGAGLEFLRKQFPENVQHIPSATRSEMIAIMREHHALLSTSRLETFGMAIAEALATGIPVVATKSGGPDQFLTEDLGILCDLNAQDIVKSMKMLEQNYQNYHSAQISSSIINKLGVHHYINQIESIIFSS